MRQWIDLFEGTEPSRIAQALHRYVMENLPVDHYDIARSLREIGYRDPHGAGRYYRALYANVKDGPSLATYGDLYDYYRQNPALAKRGPQSFCDSVHGALQYVGGTIHLVSYDGQKWPEHRMDTPIDNLSGGQFWVVYEVDVPAAAILWSIEGLRDLLRKDPKAFGESTNLVFELLEEYGWQDEIVIDSDEVRVVDAHPYDSTDHEEEYNSR